MDEVENTSVIPEAAPLGTESHESNTIQQTKPQETEDQRQEKNWKEMRRRQNELEKKLREKEEMLEKFVHMQMTQQQPKVQEIDEFEAMSDEEYIPKGKVKKLVQREMSKIPDAAKKEVERLLHEREKSQFMDRLKRTYSDFDEVVNSETLSLLEETDPELAQTIVDSNDPYKIGMQSYKYIKALNLAAKSTESRRSKEVDRRLEQNAKTIQTPQAFDKRPMAQAFKLTDAEKSKIYAEMMGFASQAGSVPELT